MNRLNGVRTSEVNFCGLGKEQDLISVAFRKYDKSTGSAILKHGNFYAVKIIFNYLLKTTNTVLSAIISSSAVQLTVFSMSTLQTVGGPNQKYGLIKKSSATTTGKNSENWLS